MEEQNCALFQGCVYKLAPMSTTTFTFYKTAKDYVMSILGNMMIADVVAGHANQISGLLSEPECTLLTQMKMDFDYIEVLPKGWFFKIDEKKFAAKRIAVRSGKICIFVLFNITKDYI